MWRHANAIELVPAPREWSKQLPTVRVTAGFSNWLPLVARRHSVTVAWDQQRSSKSVPRANACRAVVDRLFQRTVPREYFVDGEQSSDTSPLSEPSKDGGHQQKRSW